MLLQDKVVFITGGTSGIGKATVLAALREGAKVCFTWRKKEEADKVGWEAVKAWYNIDDLLFLEWDVTDEGKLKEQIEECVKQFGKLDSIFANAGIHKVGTIVDTSLEDRRKMFAVDVEGVFLTLKYGIPHLQKNGKWSIVIMGSDQCLIGKGKSSAYGAAKGAVWQLTKSTAIDYAKDNIRVNCVCPGTIDTPLARGAMKGFAEENFGGDMEKGVAFLEKAQPLERLGTPEEVAETVVFLLSDKPGFMTGSLVSIDGGYVAM